MLLEGKIQRFKQEHKSKGFSTRWKILSKERRNLISKIKFFLIQDKEIMIKHVHRETNQCANTLAKNNIDL